MSGAERAGLPPAAVPAEAFAESVHKYLREHIQIADTKAAFMSTAAAALVAFLYGQGAPKLFLKSPLQWTWGGGLAFLSTLLLAAAIGAALGVVVPRRKGSRSGLIFWEAVADQPDEVTYAKAVLSRDAGDLVREKLCHCYALARICRRKYFYLDLAVRVGAAGLICTVVFLATPH
jgi:hypothetical protein